MGTQRNVLFCGKIWAKKHVKRSEWITWYCRRSAHAVGPWTAHSTIIITTITEIMRKIAEVSLASHFLLLPSLWLSWNKNLHNWNACHFAPALKSYPLLVANYLLLSILFLCTVTCCSLILSASHKFVITVTFRHDMTDIASGRVRFELSFAVN